MKKQSHVLAVSAFVSMLVLLGASPLSVAAPINGTGNVSPDVIFGSGNDNGGFTGETLNNIEVGLRGKQRYPVANTFNYNGVDTYTFDSTVLTTNPANRSVFNFEWAINVDTDGTKGDTLNDFGYLFSFDTDPTAGVAYSSFDPFNVPGYFDHALGNNGTANGGGIEATSNAELVTNASIYNVAQQSWNLGFGFSTDPDLPGAYDFRMDVFSLATSQTLSFAEITVLVTPVPVAETPIPVPATLALFGLGLAGLGWSRRKKA